MKILFINPFGIGDVLFTTPLIRAIKESSPENSVSYWCNERVKDIFQNNPRIDKVFALSRGDLKKIFQESIIKGISRLFSLLLQIKREKFDATIDFSLDHRYGLFSQILGIKKRVGFNYKKRGWFLTHKIEIDGYSGKHVVEHYLSLLRFFDITPKTKNLELFSSENNKIKSRILLEQAQIKDKSILVGIAPGAGASWAQNASFKHWPAIRYAQLADKIIDAFGAEILVLGDVSEKPIADVMVAAMKNKATDLTGKMNLGELIATIKNLKLLVTNDGGPLHIATASDIKTVSIFGPVDEIVYGPYPASKKSIVIKKDSSCRPCYKKFQMEACCYNRECIDNIATEEVFEAVRRLW